MIDDAFVIDAIKHSHNLHPSNYAFAKHAKPIAEAVAQGLFSTSPLGTQLPQEYYQRDWRIEDTAHTTFLESDVDMAVHRSCPSPRSRTGWTPWRRTWRPSAAGRTASSCTPALTPCRARKPWRSSNARSKCCGPSG